MAKVEKRRLENVEGNFYVDSTCIDCDTCRWVAPDTFKRSGEQSAVYEQPTESESYQQALQALLACPTSSIGTLEKPQQIKEVQGSFPLLIEDNVYYCGYHSEKSFGAASYFIQHPEGNILIDSPRFNRPLVKQLEQMGGIHSLYLTHRDDVADHEKFQQHFHCQRILHHNDLTTATQDVEIILTGDEPYPLADNLLIISVPGHSKGHTVLLYDNKFLFTGDHLAFSPYLNHLYAFRRFCWYDWSEQVKSMEKLTHYSFEWVLPGHGRRYHGTKAEIKKQMAQCLTWMKSAS
ncbi:MAG: MBL fold metallo-hydrolase [Microcystaceae cyanobacterium]